MYIPVQLNEHEWDYGLHLGCVQQKESVKRNLRKDAHGLEEDADCLGLNTEGLLAEIAACKGLGIYYEPRINNHKKKADVGKNYEIRSTPNHNYKLIIRPDDNPQRYYILITGEAPNYRLHGYIKGSDAMKHDEWREDPNDRPEAWFVPKRYLRPIEELKGRIHKT